MSLDGFFVGHYDALDADALFESFPWIRAMAVTPQNAKYHAEGDVWTHTQMVCNAMTRDPAWSGLTPDERRLMLTAALFHDAGKPEVTFTDAAGSIRSPEHSLRGEILARRVLWQLEESFAFRETVAALVRQHMQPRYAPEQKDPRRRIFGMSYTLRCNLLALLGRADTRGRIAPDEEKSLGFNLAFVDICTRHDCLDRPRVFTSDHARFLYFRRALDDPDATVPPPTGPTVTIMSGLPGSGKDTWLAQHRGNTPVVSLDAIRTEIDVLPTQRPEPVVKLAHQRACELLAAGTDFIWNATTLSRLHRRRLIDILAPFDPRIEFIHLEAPPSLLFTRNRGRTARAVVPDDVIWRMTNIWQPPDLTEAHDVHYVLYGEATDQRMAG